MLRYKNGIFLETVWFFFFATRTLAFSMDLSPAGYGYIGYLNENETISQPSRQDEPLFPFNIHIDDINKSVNFAKQIVEGMKRLETNLDWSNIHILSGSPFHGQFIDSEPEPEALRQVKSALIAAKATAQLMHIHCPNLTRSECIHEISKFSLEGTPLAQACLDNQHICTQQEVNSPYYSIDGSCNNKVDGSLGKSFTGYKRLLPATYIDAVQEPRTRSIKKKRLPSPRLISTTLCNDSHVENRDLTLAVMQWTQFIEHDLAHTATNKMVHFNKTIECCDFDGTELAPRYKHPFCYSITIPDNDLFYSKHAISCMSYTRSVMAIKSDCKFGAIDQMNQATHYLDGSQIYGSELNKAYSLRKVGRGLLNGRHVEDFGFLPSSTRSRKDCQSNKSCFVSGDSRANSQPLLTTMHTLWLREHNRIATYLSRMHLKWSDEEVYQETRRIVIAEMQHITYNEWLPAILGTMFVPKIQLSGSYSSQADPRVSNSFATAGLKFLNSLMDEKLNLYKENRKIYSTLSLKENFNKSQIIEENLDGLVRGLATQSSQKLDFNYGKDVSLYLYSSGGYGFDVFSLDIQRGRDHGLPTYTSMRTHCGLSEVKEFSNLSDIMLPGTIDLLKTLYHSPEDIDLLVGGMSETPDGDSLIGPTLSCIVEDQFLRLRRGDRYFYDNTQQPKPFTKVQLAEIKKASLARIFCDNGDSIEYMQPNVFRQISKSNELVSCVATVIPYINLSKWDEASV